MATMTEYVPVEKDLLQKVDDFAQRKERSRDEIIDEAIDLYLRQKAWADICESRKEYIEKHGLISEEEIREEIKAYRAEQRQGKS